MYPGYCHSGTWGSTSNLGSWGWVGFALNLVFWIGLLAGLTLLVIWAFRRARLPATAESAYAGSQPAAGGRQTAKEILQAQYARGEITREQYEHRKQEIG